LFEEASMQTLMTRARRSTPLRWLVRSLYACAMLAAAAVAPIGAQETASPDVAAPAMLTVVRSVETSPMSFVVPTTDGSGQAPTVAIPGVLAALAVGIGIASRAYSRTQLHG